MKGNSPDREFDKFRNASGDLSKVATVIEQDSPIPTSQTPELPDGYSGISVFNQITSVPSGTESIILTHIVATQALILGSIEVSGSNRATYNLYINDDLVAVKRTNNLMLETTFNFLSLKLATSNKIEVKAIHNRPDSGEFESRLIGVNKT